MVVSVSIFAANITFKEPEKVESQQPVLPQNEEKENESTAEITESIAPERIEKKPSTEVRTSEVEHANNEEEIYYYMKAKFDLLTNDGESYDPEIHDSIVSNAASLQFGITPSEATSIYIRYEMR